MADSYRENVLASLQNLQSVENFDSLYNIYEYHQLLSLKKPGRLADSIGYIHRCLNSAKQRIEGLLLLELLARQCTAEVFSQNVSTWIDLLSELLQSRCSPVVQRLVCVVTSTILGAVPGFPEISREVGLNKVPQVLPVLLSAATEWRDSSIGCINRCMRNFPGACGPFKTKIEALIVTELEKKNVAKEVFECYALLAGCGGGGSEGVKYTQAWSTQCNKVLASLHRTLEKLYADLDSPVEASTTLSEGLPLSNISGTEIESLVQRYRVLSSCLESLLSEDFPAVACVPANEVVQLICRTLAVNNKILLLRPTTDRVCLATFLPFLHHSALSLLNCLILSCKKLLLPYSSVVVRLLGQELKWTQTTTSTSTTRHYGQLRRAVYETLTLWLKLVGCLANVKSEGAVFIKNILSDITPYEDTVKGNSKKSQEQEGAGPPPTKKKKKGRGGYQDMSGGLGSWKKVDREVGRELALSSLDALYWLVTVLGTRLTGDSLKTTQGVTIGIILELQRRGHKMAPPYMDPDCRRALYRVLLACVITPHPTAPNLCQCALALLRTGLQDTSVTVASYCTEAIAVCEVLIHPRAPCLQCPVICDVETTIIVESKPSRTAGCEYPDPSSNTHQQSSETPQSQDLKSKNPSLTTDQQLSVDNEYRKSSSPVNSQNTEMESSSMDLKRHRDASSDSDSDSNLKQRKLGSSSKSCEQIDSNTNKESSHCDEFDEGSGKDKQNIGPVCEGVNPTSSQTSTPIQVLPQEKPAGSPNESASAQENNIEGGIDFVESSTQSGMETGIVDDGERPSTSQAEEAGSSTGKQPSSKPGVVEQDEELAAMLMTFVDADPDSD